MEFRELGATGIRVSALAFGAGPVSAWTHQPYAVRHRLIERALAAGINWFDTAATYADGRSEDALGEALGDAAGVHVATKVRLQPDQLDRIPDAVRASLETSLTRLRRDRVTLLQLHNAVTAERGDEPTSITPADVLGPGGVLDTFRELRDAGVAAHLGLTGTGHADALRTVIASGEFATLQVPFNLLNPSAGYCRATAFAETDYGNIIGACADRGMGVFAIRVLAGGALAGNPPSEHTKRTRFFPLELYRRDAQRAADLRRLLPTGTDIGGVGVRFVLEHPSVSAALVGFRDEEQLAQALSWLERTRATPEPVRRAALAGWGPGGEGHGSS